MPYSIKILDGPPAHVVQEYLTGALALRARFVAEIRVKDTNLIELPKVRLALPKPYCGNHPGPCVLGGRKKPNARYLEWDDWVEFHGIVNDVLDDLKVSADVWSRPQDARGKFFMRRGLQRRVRYDYIEEMHAGRFFPIRVWNLGTPDQFEAK